MSLTLTTKVLTKDEFFLAYDRARRGGLPYKPDIYKQAVSYIYLYDIEDAFSVELEDITITNYFDSVTKFDLAYIQKPSIIGIFNYNKLYAFAVDKNLDNERRGEVVVLYDFVGWYSKEDFTNDLKTEDNIDINKVFKDEIGDYLPKYYQALKRFYNNLKKDRVSNRKIAVIDYLKYLQ